jgi:hypothetical protein
MDGIELARVCSKLQKAKEFLQEFHLLIQNANPPVEFKETQVRCLVARKE